jgi:DNA topoisomerase III
MNTGSKVISYGPCQFPTLGFVADRWLAIQAFVSHPFWLIDAKFKPLTSTSTTASSRSAVADNDDSVDFNWKRGRVCDHAIGFCLYEKCLNFLQATNNTAKVIKV